MNQKLKDPALDRQGCWLVFEGLDGTGKTTQLNLLAQALEESQVDYVRVRSPGQTYFGQKIRELLLHPVLNRELTVDDEIMLLLADRMMLLQNVIRPALVAGKIVLQDRYIPSSYLYQGYIKPRTTRHTETPVDRLDKIRRMHQYLEIDVPDLYVYLGVDQPRYPELVKRIQARPETMTHHDQYIIDHVDDCSTFYAGLFNDNEYTGGAAVLQVDAMQAASDVHRGIRECLMHNARFITALGDVRNIMYGKRDHTDGTYGLNA